MRSFSAAGPFSGLATLAIVVAALVGCGQASLRKIRQGAAPPGTSIEALFVTISSGPEVTTMGAHLWLQIQSRRDLSGPVDCGYGKRLKSRSYGYRRTRAWA